MGGGLSPPYERLISRRYVFGVPKRGDAEARERQRIRGVERGGGREKKRKEEKRGENSDYKTIALRIIEGRLH